MAFIKATLRSLSVGLSSVRSKRTPVLLALCAAALAFAADGNGSRHTLLRSSQSEHAATLRQEVAAVFALFSDYSDGIRRQRLIETYAAAYDIDTPLAVDIFAAAEEAGVDPDLAFRVVNIESDFEEMATSPVGAIGLAQVMLPTALLYDQTMTAARLYNRKVNLRIGLGYLREMLDQHEGDVKLALASYNRGPGYIERLLAQGLTPNNPYERAIMRGYSGRGILD